MLVIMSLRFLLYAPIMGVGGAVMALGKSLSLSWIIGLAVAVMIGVVVVMFSMVAPRFTKLQDLVDKINLISRESLTGMLVIRAFGNEGYEERRFDGANAEYTATNRWLQRTMATVMPMMTILMNLVMVAIIWIGGHAIAESRLLVGDMMAFMQYGMQIIMSFFMVAMMFIMMPRAAVSAKRIDEVLGSEMVIKESGAPKALGKNLGGRTVEFRGVTFRYGRAKEAVLRNISFAAKPGETTAFIGATGSGKSTLVNLVPRFYDVTEGSVAIDGVDVRDISFEELRGNIGYVPQKGVLFSGTISDNVRYGRGDASAEEIEDAIETAQASGFVSELEGGVEHGITQGGTNVSGGQRQRLAIARALARRAPIYIFDDSFSALDFKTDAALRRALRRYTSGATVMVVAQRISTIMQADQIIVLDDGEIVGVGRHKELLKTCRTYREIAQSQLSEEEM
jgi:ATP-binding cassette subfamily B protein